MKKIILPLAITFGLLSNINAQTKTIEIEPKGVFKEIDVARHNAAIDKLNGENKKLSQQTADSILKMPNYYNPPVLYALSGELFRQGKKDDAAFWLYTAQLRARYDANLCMDNSAKQATSILIAQYGPDINKYAFKNIDNLEKTVKKVVEFVKSNDENYDHRWINLHGMDAVMAGMDDKVEVKELSQPKDKWAQIKKKTIDDYYNSFLEVVKSQKK